VHNMRLKAEATGGKVGSSRVKSKKAIRIRALIEEENRWF
jgi:hypothetical protein